VSAEDGIETGTVAGEDASPIGAIEIFLYGVESVAGEGGRRESVGGPPKLFPSSRKFRELRGTIRFVPSGYVFTTCPSCCEAGGIDGDDAAAAGEDSGIVNRWACRKSGKQSPTQAMQVSMIGLLGVGNLIDVAVRLDTICSACKEKDSTYRDVIHIVVSMGQSPQRGKGRV
jgi:hypothetical protein